MASNTKKTLSAYKRRVIPRSHCVEVTACKSLRGQESYLRVLDVLLLAKNIAYWKNKNESILKSFVSKENIRNCGDFEENPGVLDQCYSNNNFVTNPVLGVRNSGVLLETRLREFNRINCFA